MCSNIFYSKKKNFFRRPKKRTFRQPKKRDPIFLSYFMAEIDVMEKYRDIDTLIYLCIQ